LAEELTTGVVREAVHLAGSERGGAALGRLLHTGRVWLLLDIRGDGHTRGPARVLRRRAPDQPREEQAARPATHSNAHHCLPAAGHFASSTSRTAVPSLGSTSVFVSNFRYFSSFIVSVDWQTVSSVTG